MKAYVLLFLAAFTLFVSCKDDSSSEQESNVKVEAQEVEMDDSSSMNENEELAPAETNEEAAPAEVIEEEIETEE